METFQSLFLVYDKGLNLLNDFFSWVFWIYYYLSGLKLIEKNEENLKNVRKYTEKLFKLSESDTWSRTNSVQTLQQN